MAGQSGLREREVLSQFAGRHLMLPQQLQNASASRVAERFENLIHVRYFAKHRIIVKTDGNDSRPVRYQAIGTPPLPARASGRPINRRQRSTADAVRKQSLTRARHRIRIIQE